MTGPIAPDALREAVAVALDGFALHRPVDRNSPLVDAVLAVVAKHCDQEPG